MRLFTLLLAALATTASTATAQDQTAVEWELVAIDGQVMDFSATLKIGADGSVSGKAPCNSYGGQNRATLPDLSLPALRATRMACDKLAEEQVYFDTLALMERVELDGPKNLVLTGPEGRSMEFTLASVSSLPDCKTCPPTE